MSKKTIASVTFLCFFLSFLCIWANLWSSVYTVGLNVNVGDTLNASDIYRNNILKNITFELKEQANNKFDISSTKCLEDDGKFIVAREPGSVDLQLKLFNLLPLPNLMVNILPSVKVMPGGHSIGVMLQSKGVMVVGTAPVYQDSGTVRSPAAEAGIKVGDSILEINGVSVSSDEEVREEINRCGRQNTDINITLKRGEGILKSKINPVYCQETGRYRVGLYIRDSASGLGTLSFYHQESKIFGALGHLITDVDTAKKIDLEQGKILSASVTSIHPGKKGQPGEKIGTFTSVESPGGVSGVIVKNTRCGVYGYLDRPLSNPFFKEPLPVAMLYEVNRGPAEIYTVIDNNKIERFNIEIVDILPRGEEEGKGLVLKITDTNLLKRTGGIIQGMSGSPIIQNGKVVGAVTHVFVNDPTRGYGVLAEWMLKESGIARHRATLGLKERLKEAV